MRRRRRSTIRRLPARTLVVFVSALLLACRREWLPLAIFSVVVLVLWLAFFKRTWCGVETDGGKACRNAAHGWLRACHLVKHRRAKNDALRTMLRLRNRAAPEQRTDRRVAVSATHLLTAAVRLLPAAERARYAEEYCSELRELAQAGAGRIAQLRYALRQLRNAPSMGLAVRSPRRRSAAP
jgi:hypothetical protein